jgi:hypothetical protein
MLWVGGDGKLYFGTYSNNVIKSSERVDDNNWQYAVATFSGSESKLYLNGTEVATDPSGAASTFMDIGELAVIRRRVLGAMWRMAVFSLVTSLGASAK